MNQPSETETGRGLSWLYVVGGVLLGVLAVFLLTLSGRHSSQRSNAQTAGSGDVHHDELFDYAINSFNRQEEFSTREMLKQALDRLDRWVQTQKPPAGWRRDPMLDTLSEPLRNLPVLAELEKLDFVEAPPRGDGQALQEAVWLRDLSNWARGEEAGDVERAEHLFDWVVRNIQLDRQPPSEGGGAALRVMQKPGETLVFGHGTASERAWVFILLLRQQGVDAAMIGPAASDDVPADQQESQARLVGVLSGEEIYLFDPELGLPVPAPDGVRLYGDGQLEVKPATLAQVAADDALLRRLDADAEHPYPLHAADLERAVAWLEASPSHLSMRMKLVESRLAGSDRMVLTAEPTAQAERFKQCPHISQVRLWTFPYQSALQEMQYLPDRDRWEKLALRHFYVGAEEPATLWKGRSYHLKGKLDGSPGAIEYYQKARPSNRQLGMSRLSPQTLQDFLMAKLDASYWLGLVSAYQGNRRAAFDYLNTRTLQAAAGNPWGHGAVYNLARMLEVGEVGLAIGLYHKDASSPSRHGNLLRAGWLESLTGVKGIDPSAGQKAEEGTDEPTPSETSEPQASPPPDLKGNEPTKPSESEPPSPTAEPADAPTDGQ